jgi:hypothetical protein
MLGGRPHAATQEMFVEAGQLPLTALSGCTEERNAGRRG